MKETGTLLNFIIMMISIVITFQMFCYVKAFDKIHVFFEDVIAPLTFLFVIMSTFVYMFFYSIAKFLLNHKRR